ncbi:HAD family hydrolase [Halobacteriales archaeon QS_1_68_20]|nr:MAG: HAD family hydrolase [Halobacteriales archaeon QS_1_68_20]
MDHELLYRLYGEDVVSELRQYQDFVDLFPPVDSRVALEHWDAAGDELRRRKERIRESYPDGETLAEVAARASREQAFTALDLSAKYGRAVNVLVLDVDETLRSAASTDNEIPRETLHVLTELHEEGMPIVICTGQTLENVKGFAIQGLGSEVVHSGNLSIVYEGGTGVFTPGHGTETKQLLYEDLGADIRTVFETVRSRVLSAAPGDVARGCHLQGNEFNVTLKPNYDIGSDRARDVVDSALVYLLDLLAEAVAERVTDEAGDHDAWADRTRAYYAAADPEIRAVLERRDELPDEADELPAAGRDVLERIDVGYYEADAAEITSLELNKVEGVKAAFDVLDVADPFALVMGDSKSDLRVMRWVHDEDCGIAAAPAHASTDVLEYVRETDDLVFEEGDSASMLRTVYAMNRLSALT